MISPNFASVLERVGRRHRRITLSVLIARSLAVGWFAASFSYLLAYLGWGEPPPFFGPAAFTLAGAAAFLYGYRPPLDALGVARLIDARLDLKDRLATALEWSGRPSPLVPWLLRDAEQHARFVDPNEVVPIPRPSRPMVFALLGALLCSALLWGAPLPSGLLVQQAPAAGGNASWSEEDELLSRIAVLREQIAGLPSPELRRLDRDLAQLQAGLRDRSVPRDEALALLRHFERRAQAALLQQASAEQADGSLGLDRIQEIAERLTVISRLEEREQEGAGSAERALLTPAREVSPEELPPELMEVLRRIAQGGGTTEPGAPQPGEPGAGQSPGQAGGPAREQPGAEGAPAGADRHSMTAAAPAGSSGDPAGEGAGEGGRADQGLPSASSGPAEDEGDPRRALPSGSAGTGAGGREQEGFEPLESIRYLEHIPGELLEGPIRAGQVNAALPGSGGGQAAAGGAVPLGPSAPQAAGEQSVERESVPLAYRDAVRNYFRRLEPEAGD